MTGSQNLREYIETRNRQTAEFAKLLDPFFGSPNRSDSRAASVSVLDPLDLILELMERVERLVRVQDYEDEMRRRSE